MPIERGEHWTAKITSQQREVRKPNSNSRNQISLSVPSLVAPLPTIDINEPPERGEHWTASSVIQLREVRKPILISSNWIPLVYPQLVAPLPTIDIKGATSEN